MIKYGPNHIGVMTVYPVSKLAGSAASIIILRGRLAQKDTATTVASMRTAQIAIVVLVMGYKYRVDMHCIAHHQE